MKSNKVFRNNGAIGALLDEYEKAIEELKAAISGLTTFELSTIVDHQSKDEDCKSIQAILSHVVSAGYNYIIVIRKWLGEEIEYKDKLLLNTSEAYKMALDQMFAFNEELFNDYANIALEEYNNDKKIKVRWGQSYDVEQLFEHAIVHILRHRRQIEKFKVRLENGNLAEHNNS